MSKVTFQVPLRNKAQWVERCVQSILEQTIDDIDVLVSDQGSDDGSYEIVNTLFVKYTGKKSVKLVRCPHTDLKGMAGLNVQFNWLHEHARSDLIISCSADDYNHPQRAEKTLEAFEKFNPSYIGTKVTYVGAGQNGQSSFPDCCSRFIAPAECIQYLIGSSASSAWARDLYEKYGPLGNIESQDMVLPIMALFERGLYYIDIPLHTYEWNPSPDNTGVMGQQLAAQTDAERLQLSEKGAFHMVYNWTNVMRRLMEHGHNERMSAEAGRALEQQIMTCASGWSQTRLALTMNRIEPVGFGV